MTDVGDSPIFVEIPRNTDNLGNLSVRNTRNEGDLAAHYNFSPERWRLRKNDTRQFAQYGSITGFTDKDDSFNIDPSAGDAWEILTAERWRYRVGYVMEVSIAFKINQALKNGDLVTITYGDADIHNVTADSTDLTTASPDGWILKFDSEGAELGIYRNGEKKTSKQFSVSKPITDLTRFELRFTAYNIGSAVLTQSFTSGGKQVNQELAEIGVDNDIGPSSWNNRLQVGIRPDSGTTNLEIESGSAAVQTIGDINSLDRTKSFNEIDLTVANADTWEPVTALRIDPDKANVVAKIRTMEILRYTANDTIEIMAIVVDATKTNASGWFFPETTHSSNNALQLTNSVSEIPNDSGTQVDPTASTNPGGYTIATDILTTDQATKTQADMQGVVTKRAINSQDIVVILAKSATTASDTITYRLVTSQDW